MNSKSLTPKTLSGIDLWQWRENQLQQISSTEEATNTDSPHLSRELDWLIREVTSLDRLALRLGLYKSQTDLDSALTLEELKQLWQNRVQNNIPLQYLLGYCNWRHFQLQVTPAVLIPRPETEEIIEIVGQLLQEETSLAHGAWVDLGTGSGAIALGLAELMVDADIHAVDISQEALDIAKKNAERYEMSDRIQFWQGSWFEPLPHEPGQLSGICSNPPYIPTEVISTLQPEVQNHEPHLALDGGADGLRDIRHLITTAHTFLRPSGLLIMECMAGQGDAIAQLMEKTDYHNIQVHLDLAGHDRFVSGRKKAD